MVRFLENISLKEYNTFGIEAKARYFFECTDLADLRDYLQVMEDGGIFKAPFCASDIPALPAGRFPLQGEERDRGYGFINKNILILGGGSNWLFTRDFDGVVIRPNIPGIHIIREDRQQVWVEAGAGEVWDELVDYCVLYGFGGIENLSAIPGSVGAAPVQNIGAYGVEAGNCIESVTGLDLEKMEERTIPGSECCFDYRDSIFKNGLKGRFIIGSVVFRLDKFPEFNLGYGDVEKEVKNLGEVSLANIRRAIVNIRAAKLPDYHETGNAGSFFKNPVVSNEKVEDFKIKFPGIPVYPSGSGTSKIAAGWLIDQCGWRGFREGHAGVHPKQALILVNYGSATGSEILNLAKKIIVSVEEKFGITLNPEVNIL
jgi:UDP-N-acetylmuramate dehydrogenase